MNAQSPIKPLLIYSLFGTPLALLVFLFLSQFFTAWDGAVVGYRPARPDTEPVALHALVLADDGTSFETLMPTELVRSLGVPVNRRGVPPAVVPEGAPITTKARFSLSIAVKKVDDDPVMLPSTSPSTLGLAIICWFVGLLLRNMYVSGSPLDLFPGDRRIKQLQAAGSVPSRPSGKSRGRQGPPQSKRGRKKKKGR